jgi:hypothetical protein
MPTVREILRSRKAAMVVVPLAVLSIFIAVWQLSAGTSSSQEVGEAFYSDDDGATWFPDAGDRIMPFDHDGKPAVGAVVFIDARGKPVVGYLIRHSPAARAAIERAKAAGAETGTVSVQPMLEAKRPRSASARWVPDIDPEFMTITHPTDQDGSPLRPAAP